RRAPPRAFVGVARAPRGARAGGTDPGASARTPPLHRRSPARPSQGLRVPPRREALRPRVLEWWRPRLRRRPLTATDRRSTPRIASSAESSAGWVATAILAMEEFPFDRR